MASIGERKNPPDRIRENDKEQRDERKGIEIREKIRGKEWQGEKGVRAFERRDEGISPEALRYYLYFKLFKFN